jgi:hypothetical protein
MNYIFMTVKKSLQCYSQRVSLSLEYFCLPLCLVFCLRLYQIGHTIIGYPKQNINQSFIVKFIQNLMLSAIINTAIVMNLMAMEKNHLYFANTNNRDSWTIINLKNDSSDYVIINLDCHNRALNLNYLNKLTPGQKQIGYLLYWAYHPLSITDEIIMLPSDEKFAQYSPPQILTQFINQRLPYFSQIKAKVLQFDKLDNDMLFNIITKYINQETPVTIYCVDDNKYQLTTIIGYNNNTRDFLYLDNEFHIKEIVINELLNCSDLTDVVAWLSLIEPKLSKFLANNEKKLLSNLKEQLQKFTMIVFENSANLDNCSIQ